MINGLDINWLTKLVLFRGYCSIKWVSLRSKIAIIVNIRSLSAMSQAFLTCRNFIGGANAIHLQRKKKLVSQNSETKGKKNNFADPKQIDSEKLRERERASA